MCFCVSAHYCWNFFFAFSFSHLIPHLTYIYYSIWLTVKKKNSLCNDINIITKKSTINAYTCWKMTKKCIERSSPNAIGTVKSIIKKFLLEDKSLTPIVILLEEGF